MGALGFRCAGLGARRGQDRGSGRMGGGTPRTPGRRVPAGAVEQGRPGQRPYGGSAPPPPPPSPAAPPCLEVQGRPP